MLKVKSGDLDKLGLLYERHKKRLFGFFYKMNSNVSLSEDMVQNVFMRMLKYKHTYVGEGSFTAWMFRLARNVNHDNFKKNKKEYNTSDLSTLEYKLKDTDDLDEKMDYNDNVSLLKTALCRLSPAKREVLISAPVSDIDRYSSKNSRNSSSKEDFDVSRIFFPISSLNPGSPGRN